MWASGDIFQPKVDELLGDTTGVKTYNDDILVLRKDHFQKHMNKMMLIFYIFCKSGLKVYSKKFSFGLKGVPYLSYVITWGGIKYQPNKVQEVIYIFWPNNTKQAYEIIVISQ